MKPTSSGTAPPLGGFSPGTLEMLRATDLRAHIARVGKVVYERDAVNKSAQDC